jgi:MOSC domain-containing protein YiiM
MSASRATPVKVLSVNAGLPREVQWRGKAVLTSIFKEPVAGRVRVGRLNILGDRQSDLSVHGGADKAIYAYPSEHYAFWRSELPGIDFPWGAFGENLTTEGLLEDAVHIGDRFRAGAAEFIVTQPRMPCFKLGIRFNRPDIVKRFLRSGRTGFYFAVLREGEIGASDPLDLVAEDESRITVADVVGLYAADAANQDLLRRASELPSLPESWREYFRERLWEPDA